MLYLCKNFVKIFVVFKTNDCYDGGCRNLLCTHLNFHILKRNYLALNISPRAPFPINVHVLNIIRCYKLERENTLALLTKINDNNYSR